jgi:mono/diheme cytochrome c family protein
METNNARWLGCAASIVAAFAACVYAQQPANANHGLGPRISIGARQEFSSGYMGNALLAQNQEKKPAGSADSAASKPAIPAASATASAALIAQGKARYQAYKCFDCHGQNGEGTDDAPDLIGTHKTEEQIAKFLEKPSADAVDKGMPDIPATSADLKPLVAYVVSLKKKK